MIIPPGQSQRKTDRRFELSLDDVHPELVHGGHEQSLLALGGRLVLRGLALEQPAYDRHDGYTKKKKSHELERKHLLIIRPSIRKV